MFQLRALLLYFMITTVVGGRLGVRSIEPKELGNNHNLHGANGQKPVQGETRPDDWGLLQLEEGVAVLDVTVRTPHTADQSSTGMH